MSLTVRIANLSSSWRAYQFLVDVDRLNDEPPVGIITDGEGLSPMGNRNCEHVFIDNSGVVSLQAEIENIVLPSRPFLKYDVLTGGLGYFSSIHTNEKFHTSLKESVWTHDCSCEISLGKDKVTVIQVSDEYYSTEKTPWYTIITTHEYRINKVLREVTLFRQEDLIFPGSPPLHSESTSVYDGTWADLTFREYPSQDIVLTATRVATKDLLHEERLPWGVLVNLAADHTKELDINVPQYLMEFATLKSAATPFMKLLQGGVSKKNIASAWLSSQYGLRLTAKDTYSAVAAIMRQTGHTKDVLTLRERQPFSIPYGNGIEVKGYRALTLYVSATSGWIMDSYRAMRKWGIFPTTEMAWDFVPLSFVVDWFLPIGNALEAFDNRALLDTYSILECLMTDKVEYHVDSSLFIGAPGYAGKVKLVIYQRTWRPNAPSPSFRFEDLDLNSTRVLNGTALSFQRWP